MMLPRRRPVHLLVLLLSISTLAVCAQYRQDFDQAPTEFAENSMPGWATRTGDGDVTFYQQFTGSSVMLRIDGRQDVRNIWYAFMHQDISSSIDKTKLRDPKYELRMEARVKASHAPRRINMYLSRLDAGGYLREFDLPTANEWHTISMITEDFTVADDQLLMTQVSLMDWGTTDIYELEIDYIKVDLVPKDDPGPSYGLPLEYRPPLRPASEYRLEVGAARAYTIDKAYPELDLSGLQSGEGTNVLMVDHTKWSLLFWDFQDGPKSASSEGQLELTTYTRFNLSDNRKDFGEIRICEILGGDLNGDEGKFSFSNFMGDERPELVINSQTIVDTPVHPDPGGETTVTISKPVMDRLLSGKTKGLAIQPLGLISTSFFGAESGSQQPKLRVNPSLN